MSKAIVYFCELESKKSDFDYLTKDEVALFGGLSFICNELNVFSRSLKLSEPSEQSSKPIKFASDLQHHVMLRTLSARVFEAHDFLEKCVKSQEVDKQIKSHLQRTTERLEELKVHEGYSINRNVRNEIAFHYNYETARKNAHSLSENADASIYFSELDGNSYCALGESLMFFERLRRFSDADQKYSDSETLAEAWLGWTLSAVELIKELYSSIVARIVELGRRKLRETHYFVDECLVTDGQIPAPVYLRKIK